VVGQGRRGKAGQRQDGSGTVRQARQARRGLEGYGAVRIGRHGKARRSAVARGKAGIYV
jgi:hypothetical protein